MAFILEIVKKIFHPSLQATPSLSRGKRGNPCPPSLRAEGEAIQDFCVMDCFVAPLRCAPRNDFFNGFAMIEAIVSIGVIAGFFLAFAGLSMRAQQTSRANAVRLKAILSLGEGTEIARDIEKRNWAMLEDASCADPNICHPEVNAGEWVLTSGAESASPDGITRWVTTQSVARDTLGYPNVIVETGGMTDPDTRRVTIAASWLENGRARAAEETTYVYR
ncbi:MAG: hypothetical protein AAB539_04540 [Patescibacteria group bacterium]